MTDPKTTLYKWTATVAALIGIAASGVAMQFFVVAIAEQETDSITRWTLGLVAGLFIITEAVLFWLAGHLKEHRTLRARLVLAGCVLLAFEVASIFGAQVVIASGQDARAQAREVQANELRQTIERQRATAEALTKTGTIGGQSVVASSRQAAVQALEKAAQLETQSLAMAEELARLEAAKVATQTTVFGEVGAVVMAGIRAVLVSGIGLLMLNLSGVLWGLARQGSPVTVTTVTPLECEATKEPQARTVSGMQASDTTATGTTKTTRYQRVQAAVISGKVRPSVRHIRQFEGCGNSTAQELVHQLHTNGIIRDQGRGLGFALVKH